VTPSKKIMKSRSWITLQNFLSSPGNAIQALRKIPELLQAGKLPHSAIKKCYSAFNVIQETDLKAFSGALELYRIIEATLKFYEKKVSTSKHLSEENPFIRKVEKQYVKRRNNSLAESCDTDTPRFSPSKEAPKVPNEISDEELVFSPAPNEDTNEAEQNLDSEETSCTGFSIKPIAIPQELTPQKIKPLYKTAMTPNPTSRSSTPRHSFSCTKPSKNDLGTYFIKFIKNKLKSTQPSEFSEEIKAKWVEGFRQEMLESKQFSNKKVKVNSFLEEMNELKFRKFIRMAQVESFQEQENKGSKINVLQRESNRLKKILSQNTLFK